MRLTIAQYGGDYREAFERFASGGNATYQAQRYSVDFVGNLASQLEQVTVVCGITEQPYDSVLANRVRAVGAGLKPGFAERDFLPALAATKPDRLVLTTPLRRILRWATSQRIPTVALLADSFPTTSLREKVRARLLKSNLNSRSVEWVGNHGLNACISLLDLGVRPGKIIPWDWPPAVTPLGQAPRTRGEGTLTLAYVGSVNEAKGVGDILVAVDLLRTQNCPVLLHVYGNDAGSAMEAAARRLNLEDLVTFNGPIPNEDVPREMQQADLVVVSSRHDCPEGLPLTIYEALSTRTPIVASDHPMFRGALTHGQDAMIFRAGDAASLAGAVRTVGEDAALYRRLSENATDAWEKLQLPVKWGDLLTQWLRGDEQSRQWLADHSLDSGRYDSRLVERRAAMAGLANAFAP